MNRTHNYFRFRFRSGSFFIVTRKKKKPYSFVSLLAGRKNCHFDVQIFYELCTAGGGEDEDEEQKAAKMYGFLRVEGGSVVRDLKLNAEEKEEIVVLL